MRSASNWFRRRTILAMATALAGAGLAGGLAGGPAALAEEKPLVIARAFDFNSLDPARSWCDSCQIYLSNVYETLIGLDADNMTLKPRLAVSWEANADQTQFTFNIDPEAMFSDGSPVEAKDLKWSWERLHNIKGGPSFMMDGVKSIEAADAHTLVVTMEAPNSEFLGILTAPYTGAINSDLAIANGANADAEAEKTDTAEALVPGQLRRLGSLHAGLLQAGRRASPDGQSELQAQQGEHRRRGDEAHQGRRCPGTDAGERGR